MSHYHMAWLDYEIPGLLPYQNSLLTISSNELRTKAITFLNEDHDNVFQIPNIDPAHNQYNVVANGYDESFKMLLDHVPHDEQFTRNAQTISDHIPAIQQIDTLLGYTGKKAYNDYVELSRYCSIMRLRGLAAVSDMILVSTALQQIKAMSPDLFNVLDLMNENFRLCFVKDDFNQPCMFDVITQKTYYLVKVPNNGKHYKEEIGVGHHRIIKDLIAAGSLESLSLTAGSQCAVELPSQQETLADVFFQSAVTAFTYAICHEIWRQTEDKGYIIDLDLIFNGIHERVFKTHPAHQTPSDRILRVLSEQGCTVSDYGLITTIIRQKLIEENTIAQAIPVNTQNNFCRDVLARVHDAKK